ncbi:MAG: Bax inhibitor-1/YccA family membrane protein, partial [Vicinamibacteria bacterium]
MRTANPTLNEKVFTGLGMVRDRAGAMTIQGTVNKTAILLALALLTAGWTWNLYRATGDAAAVTPWLM